LAHYDSFQAGKTDEKHFIALNLDGLPMSMELRGSDVENMDAIHPHYWDQLFTSDERMRKAAMTQISRGLRSALNSSTVAFQQALPRLARLLSECPFKDVHESIANVLESLSKVREKPMKKVFLIFYNFFFLEASSDYLFFFPFFLFGLPLRSFNSNLHN
jgi:hypothetical protein